MQFRVASVRELPSPGHVFISACWRYHLGRTEDKWLSFVSLPLDGVSGAVSRPDRAEGLSSSRRAKGAESGSFLESAFSCPSYPWKRSTPRPEGKMVQRRLKNEYLRPTAGKNHPPTPTASVRSFLIKRHTRIYLLPCPWNAEPSSEQLIHFTACVPRVFISSSETLNKEIGRERMQAIFRRAADTLY